MNFGLPSCKVIDVAAGTSFLLPCLAQAHIAFGLNADQVLWIQEHYDGTSIIGLFFVIAGFAVIGFIINHVCEERFYWRKGLEDRSLSPSGFLNRAWVIVNAVLLIIGVSLTVFFKGLLGLALAIAMNSLAWTHLWSLIGPIRRHCDGASSTYRVSLSGIGGYIVGSVMLILLQAFLVMGDWPFSATEYQKYWITLFATLYTAIMCLWLCFAGIGVCGYVCNELIARLRQFKCKLMGKAVELGLRKACQKESERRTHKFGKTTSRVAIGFIAVFVLLALVYLLYAAIGLYAALLTFIVPS